MADAKLHWTRMKSATREKRYRVTVDRTDSYPLPTWPTETLSDLLRVAFGDRYIADPGHPILRTFDRPG